MKGRERYRRQTTFRLFLQLKTTVCTFWIKETPHKKQVIKYQEIFKSLPIYNAFVTEEFGSNTGA